MEKFASIPGWHCIVVGDKKTPSAQAFDHPNITFIPYDEQKALGFQIEERLPVNHYSRKNLGYLYAIKHGATVIAESDDDNIPYDHWGDTIPPAFSIKAYDTIQSPRFCNVYKLMSDETIWPRGFPLDFINKRQDIQYKRETFDKICIWQGLADRDPDVDAIYRLIFKNDQIVFARPEHPLVLGQNVYCPFNSQNTVWAQMAFIYLYLPCFVSFRFTDILRGYVAQKGIWALNGRLGFDGATVYQERNRHDLMKDFRDEIECYLNVNGVVSALDLCELTGDPFSDIVDIYSTLNRYDFVQAREVECVRSWVACIEPLLNSNPS